MATEHSESEIEDWMYPYLAGALDFTSGLQVKIKKSSDYKLGYTIFPVVRFANTTQTPLGMIDMVCEEYDINTTMSQRKSGTYSLQISGAENIKILFNEIDPYLIGTTQQVGILLHSVIPALERGDHRDKHSFIRMMDDVEELRSYNNRGRDSKYTKEFFKDEWNM